MGLFAPVDATAQEADCRQALVLALDVSGSVDAGEYRLQMDGLAQALTAPEVAAAILAPRGRARRVLHLRMERAAIPERAG
ncbi:MAG: DUF1194 domain-containing protein, partial [Maritimibacter harenae]